MTPKARVVAIVALAAAVAVGGTVGGTILQTRGESTGTRARKGAPPLELAQSGPLKQAVTLYNAGRRSEAGAIFDRYHSLEAEIGSAFARWPHGSLDAVKKLVASHPRSALAELHLGLAYYWAGRDNDAAAAWQQAAKVDPDTPYAISALDLLHPNVAPNVPPIVVDAATVPRAARAKLLAGAGLLEPGAHGLGEARARRGGRPRPARPRRPHGGRGRAVLARASALAVPAPRAAHRDVPESGGRAPPSRRAPPLDEAGEEGRGAAPSRRSRGARIRLRCDRERDPAGARGRWDQVGKR